MRVPIVLAAVLLLGFEAAEPARGTREVPLGLHEMEAIFGGGGGAGQCCQVIDACRGLQSNDKPVQSCRVYSGLDGSACLNGQIKKGNYHTGYAKHCGTSQSCPKCNCTDYTQDVNGNKFSCLDYMICQFTAGVCSDLQISSQVDGATCADNCPQ
ncbi:MAG: hypothetical protein ACP5XB_30270 [Isosphaeraceae bacterium]